MRVLFVGCGDAFGTGGRFNTCFMFEHKTERFLIDCGASSLVALRKWNVDPDTIGTILITHLHGDHFGGLVFFLRQASLYKQRTRPLIIAGPPGLEKRLDAALEVFFPGGSKSNSTFTVEIVELEPSTKTKLGALEVTGFPVNHGCGAPPYAIRAEIGGKVVAYTGDTTWTETLYEAGRDADLFICEAYTPERPMGTHLDLVTVRKNLPAVNAKRVVLTHMGPDMFAMRHSVDIEQAEDGKEIEF